jgi:hypothetical protein
MLQSVAANRALALNVDIPVPPQPCQHAEMLGAELKRPARSTRGLSSSDRRQRSVNPSKNWRRSRRSRVRKRLPPNICKLWLQRVASCSIASGRNITTNCLPKMPIPKSIKAGDTASKIVAPNIFRSAQLGRLRKAGITEARRRSGRKRGGQASNAIIICLLPLFWSGKDRWSMLGWAQLAFCCGACVTTSADDE